MKLTDYGIVSNTFIDVTKINNTFNAGGRFGNIFIRNVVSDKIAQKNNLTFKYDKYDDIKRLGITLYTNGKNTYDNTLIITDKNINFVLFNEPCYQKYLKGKNILFAQNNYNPFKIYSAAWCQNMMTAQYINDFVVGQQKDIMKNNSYNERYNNNNNVFVHVRLGDIVQSNLYTEYDYYDKALSMIKFDVGFISSDSINHDICQKLICKYQLEPFESDEIDTIQFASTCKNIVLSSGTFSWVIGIFSFFSTIYYPEIKKKWHGDIFIFPKWIKVIY